MNEAEASRQIDQMVRFIVQEAKEKSEEIRMKVNYLKKKEKKK